MAELGLGPQIPRSGPGPYRLGLPGEAKVLPEEVGGNPPECGIPSMRGKSRVVRRSGSLEGINNNTHPLYKVLDQLSHRHPELIRSALLGEAQRFFTNVIGYLHSVFPTPIIYRDLTPNKVIIDQCGVAKLFDFTFSISLPPGELQVEDRVKGTFGYLEPQYAITGFITQKTDVYGFGMLMLVLFSGETAIMKYQEGTVEPIHVRDYIKDCLDNAQINQILDPQIIEGENSDGLRQNLLAFLDLALRCTEYERANRPDMLDVAKELLHIEKSVRH
ncbi:non-functional pseudokinase ZED1-like [Coffea eugenioides]|uniref:non-functional pseudokinase ZED1-like n=1 Tax=Coffea eugenioides TaxID=49369 RepID=UPI000F60DA51|nr:non-functional pseudokinase ZED1-like [Coffea eugenioides]